ncbi:MAG: LysR family transcriptional regulator [Sulfuritalea sp.]|nr:LysR family transcriptional regulator [Sulfuritalea sp.]MBK9352343.1 LysR family transcriptional regulator [Sulfuritalea sp.]MBP7423090.1 LysR family transcriptional regulator [Sulfuritalea sp.]
MFDMRRLRHALALAEHRNFARAAAALHITQPALSRSIQALEEGMGVLLFDRSPRDVEPTAFGELVLRHARGLELSSRDLDRELQLAKGLEIGTLNIGAGPWGAASMVGITVGKLSRLYPRLRTRVLISPWIELPARIRSREVDLMVADVSEVQGQDDLDITPLQPHRAFVVCRPGHPLTAQSGVGAADIFRFPLAGPHLPQHAIDKVLQHMPQPIREQGRKHGLLTITCDSSSVLKAILANSDAISIMSPFMAIKELRDGDLAMIRELDLNVQGQFGVTRLRGRTLSAPAEAFLKLLKEHDREISAMECALLDSYATSMKERKPRRSVVSRKIGPG